MAGVPLTKATRDRVEALFKGDDLRVATELLVKECGNNLPFGENWGPIECERCRFAALKLSNGRIDRLREAIQIAQKDWRDLLMAAGFGFSILAHKFWTPSPHEAEPPDTR